MSYASKSLPMEAEGMDYFSLDDEGANAVISLAGSPSFQTAMFVLFRVLKVHTYIQTSDEVVVLVNFWIWVIAVSLVGKYVRIFCNFRLTP